jgi:hypothetical protein
MNNAAVFVSIAALIILAAAWRRFSLAPAGGARLAELYLWLVPATVPVLAALSALVRTEGMVLSGVIRAMFVAFALNSFRRRGMAPNGVAFTASAALILGATVVWVAAITFPTMSLTAVAANRLGHLFTTGGFAVGALLMLVGSIALDECLRESRGRVQSRFGMIALAGATVCWLIHLAYRATVVTWLAEHAASSPPEWYVPMRLLAGALFVLYMFLAYVAIVLFGVALLRAGISGKGWGRTFVLFGLIAAMMLLAGRPPATLPLTVAFMPFAMGMLMLRRAARKNLTAHAGL